MCTKTTVKYMAELGLAWKPVQGKEGMLVLARWTLFCVTSEFLSIIYILHSITIQMSATLFLFLFFG